MTFVKMDCLILLTSSTKFEADEDFSKLSAPGVGCVEAGDGKLPSSYRHDWRRLANVSESPYNLISARRIMRRESDRPTTVFRSLQVAIMRAFRVLGLHPQVTVESLTNSPYEF